MSKQRSLIIDTIEDESGDLVRLGRIGSRYFIEKVVPAFEPGAGGVKRTYMSKKKAQKAFDDACEYYGVY